MTSKQFRGILIKALEEFLDGGDPYKIHAAPNDREFFYTDEEGNAFRVHVSALAIKVELETQKRNERTPK